MKVLTRHVWEDARERVRQRRLTERGKAIYARRKETVERSFADAKELHGHRYARRRGLVGMQEQSLLSAACQNMKKIALAVFARFWVRNPGLKAFRLPLKRFPEHLGTGLPHFHPNLTLSNP